MITVNVTYRAAAAGARFPEPLSDVECAVDFAVDTTTRLSGTSVTAQPVVLLGHSAGAHLAALSALTGDRFRKNCPYPHVDVDAVVGLSGAYDIDRLRYLAWPLFGHDVAVAPEAWRQGNPLTWVGERQDDPLRVLLVHGAADDVVPLSSTRTFAAALRRSGHAVNVVELNGADHVDTLATNQVGSLILEWVRRLPPHGDSAASRTP
jgi:acetyl esterase/lipase